MTKDRINNLKASQVIEGAYKTVRNAQQLCDEAELLKNHKMFARSYTLSHLAREEVSKVAMLYKVAIELLLGQKIEWKKVDRRFRDHKEKIVNDRALTHLLFGSMQPEENILDPKLLFNSGTIAYTNARKNSSLYVDWANGKFQSPEESVSENQAQRNLEIAIYRVALMSDAVKGLTDLEKKSPEELKIIFPIEQIMQYAQQLQDNVNT